MSQAIEGQAPPSYHASPAGGLNSAWILRKGNRLGKAKCLVQGQGTNMWLSTVSLGPSEVDKDKPIGA